MLKAKNSRWFGKIFGLYNRNLLKRRFHALRVSGLNVLHEKSVETPFIIYVNHSSWWDGLVIFEILRRFDFEQFVMMEEKQLKKLFLFRRLGAFSVNRQNPRQAIASINYAVELLSKNPDRVIFMFPQGEILPNDARPLFFYGGLSKIIQKTRNCAALPIALRYEFRGDFKPEIFVKIGAPEFFNVEESTAAKFAAQNFSARLTKVLDDLKSDAANNNLDKYENLWSADFAPKDGI